ncbi:MAG: hypothetical protein ACKVVT_08485 [Dehalococcoidia bacterium]
MDTITLAADEADLAAARACAAARGRTLDEEFQAWLKEYAKREREAAKMMAVIRDLQLRVDMSGVRLSREERNAR